MRLTFLSLAMIWLANGSSAGTLVCNMDQNGSNGGWIAPVVTINFEDEGEVAVVSDAVITEYVGRPVMGELETSNDAKMAFVWTVASTKPGKIFSLSNNTSLWGGGSSKLRFRLAYFRSSGAARISAVGSDYHAGPSAGGTCTLK